MMDSVHVIVPTLNRPGMLARALASIRAQTYPQENVDILVVNDGGEDVRQLCELFGAIYMRHGENQGLPAARNTAIRSTWGGLIAYLDDDDVWLPKHLEILTRARRDSGCRLVYSNSYYWFDERTFDVPLNIDFSRERLLEHNLTPCCSILHDWSLIQDAGLFDERLPNHEDWDLWIRMSQITPFFHVREVTALYSKRQGSDQMSMDLVFMAKNKREMQEKYSRTTETQSTQRD